MCKEGYDSNFDLMSSDPKNFRCLIKNHSIHLQIEQAIVPSYSTNVLQLLIDLLVRPA